MQFLRRKRKTVAALKPIHCTGNVNSLKDKNIKEASLQPVHDGLWTTLVGSASKSEMKTYLSHSQVCLNGVIPSIVNGKIEEYESSKANQIRSMRVLYEGGLISKRKYTCIRNSSDVANESGKKVKSTTTEIMKGCHIPKIVSYKTLMAHIKSIDIGEVVDLETFATQVSREPVSGVYRPLKPFLLKLADLYLHLDKEIPMLHLFNGEKGVFRVAVGADGAPFGKDDEATGENNVLNMIYLRSVCLSQ